jgi:integrase
MKLATVTPMRLPQNRTETEEPRPIYNEPRLLGGSVETVRNKAGQIIGYQGRLPRSKSKAPNGKSRGTFRERVGSLKATRGAAIEVVNAALKRIQAGTLTQGQTYKDWLDHEIKVRHQAHLTETRDAVLADKRVGIWRSCQKNWLSTAPFYEWPISSISNDDCQSFINSIVHRNELSGGSVRNIAQMLKLVFKRAKVRPNPAHELDVPERGEPKLEHMRLAVQRRFFSNEAIPIADRIMVGCGMGAGLRIGELLSLEPHHIEFDGDKRGRLTVEYGGDRHAQTKSGRTRTVELFEPGLGFFKLWMRDHYTGGPRVFEGPKGGYLSTWGGQFKQWTGTIGQRMFSHLMRHSYAMAMLNGWWGYELKPLGFIQAQLGHTEISTTERYYAHYMPGTWADDVDRMTGHTAKAQRPIVTASGLLSGLADPPKGGTNPGKNGKSEPERVTRWSHTTFPGIPEGNEQKAACDGPPCQLATLGRFQPRRRRRNGGVA